MKLVKSLLLGSAAGLVAAAGAQAADLPTRKAAPVDYVRICAVHGPGFFYIPGSDTCIRLSGRARFEYFLGQNYNKGVDKSSFGATGRFAIDARTQTDYGLLRAYTRVDFSRGTGNNYFGSGSGLRRGTAFSYGSATPGGFSSFSGVDPNHNVLETSVNISAAFVQFGGLTAGRIQSFFDFYADNDTWFGTTDSDTLTQALAYTYTFGSGFSATLSIEDPAERQKNPIAGIGPVTSGAINPSAFNASYNLAYPGAGVGLVPGVVGVSYAKQESIPDFVGVLRVDQGWGSAQLSGASHQVTTVGFSHTTALGGLQTSVPGGYGNVNDWGYAVQGGVKINLPMIAPGDNLYAQVAYSKGNLSYVNSGYPSTFQGSANSIGGTTFNTYDAVTGPYGNLVLTPAYSGVLALTHYWVPTLRSSLVLGAEHIQVLGCDPHRRRLRRWRCLPRLRGDGRERLGRSLQPLLALLQWRHPVPGVGNLIWSPVKDLDIGIELIYLRNQMQHTEYDLNKGNGATIKSDDVFSGRIRVSRDF